MSGSVLGRGVLSLFRRLSSLDDSPPPQTTLFLLLGHFRTPVLLRGWRKDKKKTTLVILFGRRAIQGRVGARRVDADVQIYLDNLKIGLGLLRSAVVSFPDELFTSLFSCLILFTAKPRPSVSTSYWSIFFSFPSCSVTRSLGLLVLVIKIQPSSFQEY